MANELMVLETSLSAVELFCTGKVDDLIDKLEKEVRSLVLDISTDKGRKEIASIAYKVARSKTAFDDLGKDLVADKKAECAKVDAERKKIRDRFDALKDEVRKPLTDWENKEKNRITRHEGNVAAIKALAWFEGSDPCTADLERRLAALSDINPSTFEEFEARARAEVEASKSKLSCWVEQARIIDAERAELARLRAEDDARKQREHDEAVAREAADKAKREAEAQAVAVAAKAEAERVAIQSAKDEAERRAKQAEADAVAQKARMDQERIDAEAKAREDERRKIEAEKAKDEAEQVKREADKKHKAVINNAALDALIDICGLDKAAAKWVVSAVANNQIPNVKINY